MRCHKLKPVTSLSALLLCGCLASVDARRDNADHIAASAHLLPATVAAGAFNLSTWQKFDGNTDIANVYIEGDGLAYVSRRKASGDPTPVTPVALELAAQDPAQNVVYLARPCQYSGLVSDVACPDFYWTSGRTAPDVITAYQSVLDNIKSVHHLRGFNLIGFSGGASVAAIVTAGRNDVLSLRTVAGNIHYAAFAAEHKLDPMTESIAPETMAAKITNIPQMHFIGADDSVVPASISAAWKQASGDSTCIETCIVSGIDHHDGWQNQWRDLLQKPLPCQ